MFSKFKKSQKKSIPKVKVKKKVKLKSQTKSKKVKKVNSQQKVKKVKQKLCIGKQVREKLVTRQIAAFLLMAYGFQSIKNSRTFLVVQLSPFPAPSQPQPPTPESQDPYPAPATVPGSLQPQASCCKFWGRLLPGPGFGLAAAGSWRRGQVEVELRQATDGLGHAGLGGKKI